MNPSGFYLFLEQCLSEQTGSRSRIVSRQSVSGGCINDTEIVTLADQRQFFVKSNQHSPDLFVAESKGLAAIAGTKSIRVPSVIGFGTTHSGTGFLILEVIENGKRANAFFEDFGRSLADMHKAGRSDQFGFDSNNHIGSTPQINSWMKNWVEFWAENRLGYQLRLAVKNGFGQSELSRRCETLISKLDRWIEIPHESPALIHGDLWSGNWMTSELGQPVLIDPAVYYGSREAEFGMTKLFGGFSSEFYHAYNEAWPLNEGWQHRVEIYKLYHLLNHLNLFGSSYLGGCLDVLRRLA